MSSKWCSYFNETDPKEYRFLGFYEYRSKQVDFTFSFQKESYKLQMDLVNLMKSGSEELKETASRLNKIFKGHRDAFYDVSAFWNKIELNERLRNQLQTAEVEAASSLISTSSKTFATAIGNVHSSVENVNDILTMTGNHGKRTFNVTSMTGNETTDPKRTKVTFDMSFDEYVDAASIITETVRDNDAAAHTNPSWWGILGFREEGVHPSPNLPRAKKFLPEKEVDQLMAMSKRIIEEAKSKIGKSAKTFLDALSRSDIISLSVLAKEKGARGIVGLCTLLKKEVKMDDLSQFADTTLYKLSSIEHVELADIDIEDDEGRIIN